MPDDSDADEISRMITLQKLEQENRESKEALQRQLEQYQQIIREIYQDTGRVEVEALQETNKYFQDFLNTRTERAEKDLESPEFKEALAIARELFPDVFGSICMDGRTPPLFLAGIIAKLGGWTRVPGGILLGFEQSEKGKFFLPQETDVANKLDKVFENIELLTEILVTHLGCAAAKKDSLAGLADGGTLENLMKQQQRILAITEYALAHHGDKELIPLAFIYNQEDGYGYMGAETLLPTDNNLDTATKNFPDGFTKKELDKMSAKKDGKIISTESLVKKFEQEFERAKIIITDGKLDWKKQYERSALDFWKAIKELTPLCLPTIEAQVMRVYPHLATAKDNGAEPRLAHELQRRSMLCLLNTFSGYLGNYKKDHDETHIIVKNAGEYELYDMPTAFRVYSGDVKQVPGEVELATTIVRNNRAPENRLKPIPVIITEKIDGKMPSHVWSYLSKIDWNVIYRNAIDWRDEQIFTEFVQQAMPQGTLIDNERENIVEGLVKLQRAAAALYMSEATKHQLYDGNIIFMATLTDSLAQPRGILPLIAKGSNRK